MKIIYDTTQPNTMLDYLKQRLRRLKAYEVKYSSEIERIESEIERLRRLKAYEVKYSSEIERIESEIERIESEYNIRLLKML